MIMETVRKTTRSDCGHVGATRRAGEVRASAPIRALVAVFVALLAVHFMPGTAYADSVNAEIISGPSQVPILDMYGASIAAPDRYIAAALLMGYGPDAVSGWDDDVKAKLSNEGTGGQFYIFANNSVQNYFDITEHTGIFQQFFDYVGGTFWNAAQALYGNNLWAALYTSDELAAAKADLQRVLSGENIGGGITPLDGYKGMTCSLLDDISGNVKVYESTSMETSISVPVTDVRANWGGAIYFKESTYNVLADFSDNYGGTGLASLVGGGRGYRSDSQGLHNFGMYVCVPSYTGTLLVVNSNTNGGLDVTATKASNNSTGMVQWIPYNGSLVANVVKLADKYYLVCNVVLTSVPSGNAYSKVTLQAYSFNGVETGTPVIPPTQWPDEPSAPSPPELPEPGTNPTVTPTPWAPVISPTFDLDLNITTEPTSNDLIDWVKKIYFELRSFHGDAHDWFDDVGKGIDAVVKAVNDAQKQIYSELQTIDDTIRDEGQKIRDYMYRMFHWLKDQLNFQNDTFNDNNIVYWLKRIWSKLGNGDINVRPTDPTTDPTGVWDWLIKLIQNFLIGLASSANDLISEMADLVSQVMHQFPFSIPWDIAAFLAAFAAAPITPDVDVTIPAIEGWWGETVISIDLSPYDSAAAAVRAMEKILFAAFLAWKSKDLLEFMDVTKWFNG